MRWKYVIPGLILIAVIAALYIFFFDTILKNTLTATGEMIFGARVDIANVKTDFRNLSVKISGLQVANKDNPWRNLFAIDKIYFAVKPGPLFMKKFIIEEVTVEKVTWDTRRTVYGALPPRKQAKLKKTQENEFFTKVFERIKKQGKAQIAEIPALQTIDTVRNLPVDKLVSIDNLQSLKEMDSLKDNYNARLAGLETGLQNLKTEEKIAASDTALKDVKAIKTDTLRDIEAAQRKIKLLKQTGEELEKTLAEVKKLRSRIDSDLGEREQIIKEIQSLKDKDRLAVTAGLKLPSISRLNIAEDAFGPVWAGRIEQGIQYAKTAQKYLPPRKKEAKSFAQPRLAGMDVSFPRRETPPDFLIKKIKLSGSTGGPGKAGEALDFTGTVTDITSDPVLLGRPVRVKISGAKGERELVIEGTFDHTREEPVEKVDMYYRGIIIRDYKMGSAAWIPSLQSSRADVAAGFLLEGNRLNCSIQLNANDLQWKTENKTEAGNEFERVVAGIWAGISTIAVNGRLYGELDKLKMDISSNLDEVFSAGLRKIYGEKLDEIKARIDGEIQRLTVEKEKQVLAEISQKKDAVKKQFELKQKQLNDKITAVKAEIGKKEKEIKERPEKKAGDKVQDKLKKLLR